MVTVVVDFEQKHGFMTYHVIIAMAIDGALKSIDRNDNVSVAVAASKLKRIGRRKRLSGFCNRHPKIC